MDAVEHDTQLLAGDVCQLEVLGKKRRSSVLRPCYLERRHQAVQAITVIAATLKDDEHQLQYLCLSLQFCLQSLKLLCDMFS